MMKYCRQYTNVYYDAIDFNSFVNALFINLIAQLKGINMFSKITSTNEKYKHYCMYCIKSLSR